MREMQNFIPAYIKGRTYGRTYSVRTTFSELKFLGCIDYQIFLSMVLRELESSVIKKKTDFQSGLQTSHFRLRVNSCEKVSILYQLLTFFLLFFLFLFSKIRLSSFYKANTFKRINLY